MSRQSVAAICAVGIIVSFGMSCYLITTVNPSRIVFDQTNTSKSIARDREYIFDFESKANAVPAVQQVQYGLEKAEKRHRLLRAEKRYGSERAEKENGPERAEKENRLLRAEKGNRPERAKKEYRPENADKESSVRPQAGTGIPLPYLYQNTKVRNAKGFKRVQVYPPHYLYRRAENPSLSTVRHSTLICNLNRLLLNTSKDSNEAMVTENIKFYNRTDNMTQHQRSSTQHTRDQRRSVDTVQKSFDSKTSSIIIKILDERGKSRIIIRLNPDDDIFETRPLDNESELIIEDKNQDMELLSNSTTIKLLPNVTVVLRDIYNKSQEVYFFSDNKNEDLQEYEFNDEHYTLNKTSSTISNTSQSNEPSTMIETSNNSKSNELTTEVTADVNNTSQSNETTTAMIIDSSNNIKSRDIYNNSQEVYFTSDDKNESTQEYEFNNEQYTLNKPTSAISNSSQSNKPPTMIEPSNNSKSNELTTEVLRYYDIITELTADVNNTSQSNKTTTEMMIDTSDNIQSNKPVIKMIGDTSNTTKPETAVVYMSDANNTSQSNETTTAVMIDKMMPDKSNNTVSNEPMLAIMNETSHTTKSNDTVIKMIGDTNNTTDFNEFMTKVIGDQSNTTEFNKPVTEVMFDKSNATQSNELMTKLIADTSNTTPSNELVAKLIADTSNSALSNELLTKMIGNTGNTTKSNELVTAASDVNNTTVLIDSPK